MKTEIGTPCIQRAFIVLLLLSSLNSAVTSLLHVVFRALNLTPSFAKLPTLKRADAKKSGRNRSVSPQKMSCMLSSVTGKPFFQVNNEQPKCANVIALALVKLETLKLSGSRLTNIFLKPRND
jgi:hypothetical protein